MSFLPAWPLDVSQLLLFSLLLIAGLAAGELGQRLLRLPRITGYVVAGLVIGHLHDGVAERPMFDEARVFAEVALGLVLFIMGRRLDFSWLRRDRWLAASGVVESAATFGATYLVLRAFGIEPLWATIAGAIAMSTSPAVVLLVVRDNRAEGQMTERLLCLSAMNSIFAVLALTMLLSWLHLEYQAGLEAVLFHPFYLVIGSLLLAWGMGFALMRAARLCGKREAVQFVLILGAVLLTAALAQMLRLSVPIALLAMGVLVRNFDRDRSVLNIEFGYAVEPFFVVLFVIVGLRLPLGAIAAVWQVALAYFAVRLASKIAAIYLLGRIGGAPAQRSWLTGLALAPMAGVATILASDVVALYPETGARFAAIVLGAVTLGTVLGPIATQFALRRMGEAAEEAA
jgi:Kef-type K+ transport system membrane component KefB